MASVMRMLIILCEPELRMGLQESVNAGPLHVSELLARIVQVVEMDDGRWKCEYDGAIYDTMVRRYIMQACFADFTGEAVLYVFNDQVTFHLAICVYSSSSEPATSEFART